MSSGYTPSNSRSSLSYKKEFSQGNVNKVLNPSKLNMINQKSIEQQKCDFLEKQGWVKVEPEFDFGYVVDELGIGKFVQQVGFFASSLSKEMTNNPFAIFGEEIKEKQDDFMISICPNLKAPTNPTNKAMISSQWPLSDGYSTSERAFEELTYRTINLIVTKVLGTPENIYVETAEHVFRWPKERVFNFDNLEIVGELIAVWEEAYLRIEPTTIWGDNGSNFGLEWKLYSNFLRSHANAALGGVGIEINPKTYQLGDLDPEYAIDSFPPYIKGYTEQLKEDMFVDGLPDRYNILIDGPPGFGKTRWSQAFATEVLGPMGYLVMVVDYNSLQDLVLPSYLDKVCIVVNDADTLALAREESVRGETEQVMAWLDGTRSTFIKPFFMDRRTSTITIMTANSTKRWDKAALRKGRIHATYTFDKVNLSEKDG